jgi:hypothetical protein
MSCNCSSSTISPFGFGRNAGNVNAVDVAVVDVVTPPDVLASPP